MSKSDSCISGPRFVAKAAYELYPGLSGRRPSPVNRSIPGFRIMMMKSGPAEGLQHTHHGGNMYPENFQPSYGGTAEDTGRPWLHEMLDEEVTRQQQHFICYGSSTSALPFVAQAIIRQDHRLISNVAVSCHAALSANPYGAAAKYDEGPPPPPPLWFRRLGWTGTATLAISFPAAP